MNRDRVEHNLDNLRDASYAASQSMRLEHTTSKAKKHMSLQTHACNVVLDGTHNEPVHAIRHSDNSF